MADCNPHSIAFPHCKGRLEQGMGPGRRGPPARGAGGAVHRILPAPAPPLGAGLRRHGRSGTRHAGRSFLPRVTTATAFRGDRPLLAAWLRPGGGDGARHAWAILALLVKRLRRAWPDVKIVFRGDGGFHHPRILSWCERNRVDHIVGIARNATLAKKAESIMELAAMGHEAIRRVALAGGELANAHVGTIRLKLLKIGAVVLRNTRRVRLPLSSRPHQILFHTATAKLRPG